MRTNHQAIQKVLNAFLGLFTQPFEQDIGASSKAAATAISLATLPGLGILFNGGIRASGELVVSSLGIALVWMLLTAVVTKQDKNLVIARNLSVLAFWIAATLVIIFGVNIVRPDPLDAALRRVFAVGVLLLLVPVHMFRNLPCWSALRMTLSLWISTIFLAWRAL